MNDIIQLAKKYWLGAVLSIISLIIIDIIFDSVCFSVILFGIPCPTCGITRATKLLITGHFRESYQMHPLLILVIFGFVCYPIIKKLLNNYRFFIKSYVIICIGIFVIFYIYRMKMFYPNMEPMVYRQDNYLHRIMVILHEVLQRP